MEQPESFGRWLKQERRARRLSQKALGEHVSYGADHIRKVEADERRFGEAQARSLAEFFGIPPDEQDAFVTWARGGPPPTHLTLTAPVTQDGNDQHLSADPEPMTTAREAPTRDRLRRFRWFWLPGVLLIIAIVLTVVLLGNHRGQSGTSGHIVPGGRWLSPDQHFMVRGDTLHFAARAYQARADYPPIASVNFTISWPAPTGDWQTACTVTTPLAGTRDEYTCDWNLATASVPDGPIRVSFDVYDAKGNYNMAPNGIHEGMVQR